MNLKHEGPGHGLQLQKIVELAVYAIAIYTFSELSFQLTLYKFIIQLI